MAYKNIQFSKDNRCSKIVLNRPNAMNALDEQTVQEIWDALDYIENDDDIRVIIFTGAGKKAFAAGAETKQLQHRKSIDVFTQRNLTKLCSRIEAFNKATIAAINGFALGGGLELALSCDIRIATENSKMGLPELNLGVIPGAGGTQRLSRIAGKGLALDMVLTGTYISADEAKQVGLVSQIVKSDELLDLAYEKAKKIIDKGPLAVQLAKLSIHTGHDVDMDTGVLIESLIQSFLYGTEDKHEGTSAFMEKRKASFIGK
ncbi:enoyl-CoA hydratase/isomerase family protein [Oceanobacillus sp. 1P07AA]|uniref:enoyl-CoA hydratase/isomerase family protein n=1 Tax=Oceanobacillus sp. 1P07AA TaxID=3132293 RepID=UPI0039A4C630